MEDVRSFALLLPSQEDTFKDTAQNHIKTLFSLLSILINTFIALEVTD